MNSLNEFFVTLMSNASTNEFSENSLSNFSNKLPQHLDLDDLNQWYVSLHSLGVSNRFRNIIRPQNKNLPSFKLIIRAREKPKETSPASHKPKLTQLGLHSLFNRTKYTSSFIDSLKNQPTNFMEILSHDTNIFGDNKDEIIQNHASLSEISTAVTRKNLEPEESANMFNKKETFSVETDHILISFREDCLTVEEINEHFKIWDRVGVPLSVKVSKGEYFLIKAEDSELFANYSYTLMIHSSSVDIFNFQVDALRMTEYEGESYFCKDFNNKFDVLIGQSKNWFYNYPQIISVECDQVKEQAHNSLLEKHVSVVCPQFQEENYFNFFTEIHHFHPLSNNYLDKISVRLKDLDNQLLNLLPGPATYVKLLFKKMSYSDSFNVRLTNNGSKFESVLPQPINLDHTWKVSLSSISFPTEYLPLPLDRLKRKIWYVEEGKVKVSTLPNIQYTKSLLVQMVNQIFNKTGVKCAIENDRFIVTTSKSIELGMSLPVAQVLGFDKDININQNTSSDYSYFTIEDYLRIRVNQVNRKPMFYRTINLEFLRPYYLMVYASIIDHCIVGSQYIKLLRISPVNRYNGNSYELHEFPRAEFHGLESTYFDSIKIEIRDHSGDLVNFIDKKLSLNLHFSNEQN